MGKSLNGRKVLLRLMDGRQLIITIEDEAHIAWRSLVEPELTKTHQPLQMTVLNEGQVSLNWSGDQGPMSLVFDLNRHTVTGVQFTVEEPTAISGSLQLLNDDERPDLEPFTNSQLVVAFWNDFFNRHDVTAVARYLAPDLIQHNPSITDGADALLRFYAPLFGTNGSLRVAQRTVVSVGSRDDLVYLHVMRQDDPAGDKVAEVDIFRVRDERLVEHWIVKQPFPNHSANNHPMF
ncbi:nuclear transport factor 2 family protein [Furfurilactobacillus entadae]|uniref:nuclear transport factor 2 family protein n=1 Tax=Furfurilactobacillus entadae TaxID=2922307 RepID=UPI0035ECF5B6